MTLLNICDNILKNMEDGKCTSIVSLDLSAAFDMVNHAILLEVLSCYFGITEHALSWISSYLSSRRFQVQVGHLTSKTVEIDFSVPQGSILGPIFVQLLCKYTYGDHSGEKRHLSIWICRRPCNNPLLQSG